MHRLLARQIRRALGSEDAVPASMAPLLALVDEAYRQGDEDRRLLERSLDLTSEELLERNEQLRRDNERLVAGQRARDEALSVLQATLEATADGILVVDLSGRVVSSNRLFGEMWGFSDELLAAADDQLLISRAKDLLVDPAAFVGGIAALYGRPEQESYDYLELRDGRVFERYSCPQWIEDRCVGRVWSFRDITERRRAEEAVRRTEEQLRLAQRMEAIGRLAGGVAHDFNNLLTAILGSAALVHEGLAPEDPLRPEVAEISRAGGRAAELTRQLLAFGRQQVLDRRPLELNRVVTDLERLLRRLVGENIRLETSLAADLGVIEADPSQVEQVVINLVVNARDAVRPRGGTITLETANVLVDAAYRRRRPIVPNGRYVMLTVSDDGEGIPADRQERIFEPFYTTKEPGQGTGLGLAVVYGIVKQSGGFIWLYSEPGQGTTFRIYFPQHAAAEAATPVEEAEPAPAEPSGGESILLVEDEPLVRRLAARILRGRGYRVVEVPDPAQALEVAGDGGESFDLLLTDVVMPGMSGNELARRIRRLLPWIRVVFMSGYSESLVRSSGLDPRDGSYLAKPFSAAALLETVRAELAAGRVRGTATAGTEDAERAQHG